MAFKALLSYFSVNTSTQSSSSTSEYTFYGFFFVNFRGEITSFFYSFDERSVDTGTSQVIFEM